MQLYCTVTRARPIPPKSRAPTRNKSVQGQIGTARWPNSREVGKKRGPCKAWIPYKNKALCKHEAPCQCSGQRTRAGNCTRAGQVCRGRADLGCKHGVGHVTSCILEVRRLQQLTAGGPPCWLELDTCLDQNSKHYARAMFY